MIASAEEFVCEEVVKRLEKKFWKKTKQQIKKAVKNVLKSVLRKFVTTGLAKKIPVASIAVGTAGAVVKGCKADWHGAAMEFASGAVACIPVAGTSASVAIDLGILVYELQWRIKEELDD